MIKRIINYLYYKFATPETYARHIGVKIGKGCFIATKSFTTEPYLIEIGNYVRVAPRTAFFTHGGVWSIRKRYNDPNIDTFGKIRIGDYSYIGDNCMIMPGVTIGENCIVGGGSVVTKSVPDGVMVAGNPARFIGYTKDFYERLKVNKALCCKGLSPYEKKKYLLSLDDQLFSQKGFIKIPQ